MSIDVRVIDDSETWNSLLTDAPTATAFHRWEALDVLAEDSASTPHHLAGYKGEEPVGVLPFFTKTAGPVTAAFSPPPSQKVPYLGPVMQPMNGAKRLRVERRNSRFVDACQAWIDDEYNPRFTTVLTAPGYTDARPFIWNDYEPTPRYTYVVDLDRDRDDLLASFSRNARRNVTDVHDVDYEIVEGGREAIAEILPAVAARHEEQGEHYPIGTDFVTRLYDAPPAGTVRPLVCRVDGEFAGGQVILEAGDTATLWLATSSRDVDLPVGDLLVWWYVESALDGSISSYDLAGANLKRLSHFKAKFDSDLVPYYRVQKGTWGMNAASKLFCHFPI